jgi:hypothetical protein
MAEAIKASLMGLFEITAFRYPGVKAWGYAKVIQIGRSKWPMFHGSQN